jgi:type I restriction enzyme, S subunit
MTTKSVELGDLLTIDRTTASQEECRTLPYIGLEHIDKDTGTFIPEYRRIPETVLATKFRFTANHVLYGKLRPYLNKVLRPKFDGVCTTEILPLLTNEVVLDAGYLYFLLQSSDFVKWATHHASGANLPRLDPKTLKDYRLSLPSVSEQRVLANRLQMAQELCQTRRYALHISDELLQALFLQMFGDPQKNPNKWDQCTIDDVLEWSQYGTSQKSNMIGRGYPVLGMGNITEKGHITLSPLGYVELSRDEFEELKLQPGDIIFNRTNSTELVGKTACWRLKMDAVVASYLVRLRLKPSVNPEFFACLLNTMHYKNLFRQRCKKAVNQSNISPTLLREFRIYLGIAPVAVELEKEALPTLSR